MRWRFFVCSVLFVMLCGSSYADDGLLVITVGELNILQSTIEAQAADIERLREDKIGLINDKIELLMQIDILYARLRGVQDQLDDTKGVYVGGSASYPWGITGHAWYNFGRWGPMFSAGYIEGPYLGIGALIKFR